jgi:hypothetical protein
MVVSPGCTVSRARTDLPAGEITCAFHGSALPEIVERLERSAAADHAVAEYAVASDRHFVAVPSPRRPPALESESAHGLPSNPGA